MADYFLVTNRAGATWDAARSRRTQIGWDEHAAFMDALVAEGVVVLGGPVGDVDEGDVLLVFDVESEDAARPPRGRSVAGHGADDRERRALVGVAAVGQRRALDDPAEVRRRADRPLTAPAVRRRLWRHGLGRYAGPDGNSAAADSTTATAGHVDRRRRGAGGGDGGTQAAVTISRRRSASGHGRLREARDA